MDSSTISDLLIILAAGFVAGTLCRRIGLSTLVGYLAVGAIIGAGGLAWVTDEKHEIEYLAEIGVLMLLFSIGLEFSLDQLARSARHILVAGSFQMLTVAIPSILLMALAGKNWQTAVLIGCAIAMSSTVLVFKALAEHGETTKPAGRRAISILLFQDIAIVPLLLLVPILTGHGQATGAGDYIRLAGITMALIIGVPLLRKILIQSVVPLLTQLRSPELIVLFALATLGAITFVTYKAGLPPPLGALAAGLILSGNRLTKQIDALVLPFREAFAAIFFVSLGLLFNPSILLDRPLLMGVGFVSLLLLKTVAAGLAARITGLGWKASAGVGIGLCQIGEFAFVLAFAGWEAGLLSETDYQRILVCALASLVLTPQFLKIGMGWAASHRDAKTTLRSGLFMATSESSRAVVVGIGPIGRGVIARLQQQQMQICAVDLSPVNLYPLAQEGCHTVAGDARNPDTLNHASLEQASLVVVCVPSDEIAVQIVSAVRHLNGECLIVVRCRFLHTICDIEKAGANAVVSEEAQSSKALVDLVADLQSTD